MHEICIFPLRIQNLSTLIKFDKKYKLTMLLHPAVTSTYSLWYTVLIHPSFCSSHHVTYQVPCSYKAKGKITYMYIQTLCLQQQIGICTRDSQLNGI